MDYLSVKFRLEALERSVYELQCQQAKTQTQRPMSSEVEEALNSFSIDSLKDAMQEVGPYPMMNEFPKEEKPVRLRKLSPFAMSRVSLGAMNGDDPLVPNNLNEELFESTE